MLFASKNASRDTSLNPPSDSRLDARSAYNRSAPPQKTPSSARMNIPRAGSDANACTETSTGERVRNVPSKLSENPEIASSTVQLLNIPRRSATASECSNAVAISQGMNDEFSTGSQNHHPPQPSS